MKRIIITEEQYRRYILKEELGLSDHVRIVSDKIYEMVMNSGSVSNNFVLENFDFVGSLNIEYVVKNAQSIEEIEGEEDELNSYIRNVDKYNMNNDKIVGYVIHVEAIFYQGELMSNLRELITHEVEHLYSYYCRFMKPIGYNPLRPKDDRVHFYNTNFYDNDIVKQTVSKMFYFMNGYEINAFSSGLYGNLAEYIHEFTDDKDMMNKINNVALSTNSIKNLESMKKYFNCIKNWNEEEVNKTIVNIGKEIGTNLNYRKLLKMALKTINVYERKFERVKMKFFYDLKNNSVQ